MQRERKEIREIKVVMARKEALVILGEFHSLILLILLPLMRIPAQEN